MGIRRSLVVVLWVIVAGVFPALAHARQVRQSEPAVWISTDAASEIDGTLGLVTDKTVEVHGRKGVIVVERSRIARIQVPDSVTNGAKIGAAIGGAGGAVLSALAAPALCEGYCNAGEALVFVGLNTGLGMGLGALAGALSDSLHVRRRTVFDSRTGARLSVAPIVGVRTGGVSAAVRW